MTEDHNHQNDQATGEPVSGSEPEAPPTAVPESTGQSIALPPTTPPAPADPIAVTPQPDTPPMGVPQGSDLPQGSYAMGALAGNPMLGEPTGGSDAGPPTDPNAPMWGAPVAPAAPAAGAHHVRNGVLAGVAAFALLAGGVAIGHAAWTGGTSNLVIRPVVGQHSAPVGFGQRIGEPLRERLAVRRRLRQLRQHGQSATPGTATRARRAGPARVTPVPSRPRSTRASSTSTRRSATRRSRLPVPASCSPPTA